jgi:hypothetical protein
MHTWGVGVFGALASQARQVKPSETANDPQTGSCIARHAGFLQKQQINKWNAKKLAISYVKLSAPF